MSYRNDFLIGLSLAAGLLSACSSDDEEQRPGLVENVGTNPGNTGTISMGGEPSTEDGSATGTVEQWTDDLFASTTGFASPSNVQVVFADGSGFDLGEYDGADFQVDGDVGGTRWVQVSAINDSDVRSTMTEVDLSDGAVTLPVIQESVLDAMLQTLNTATEIDDNAAQVIIHVVDGSGANVIGVEADTQASGPGIIAYREDDGVWQDLDDGTNEPGLILLPNLDTLAFPGQEIQVILSGTIDGTEVNVRIAAGAVSFVTVVVP